MGVKYTKKIKTVASILVMLILIIIGLELCARLIYLPHKQDKNPFPWTQEDIYCWWCNRPHYASTSQDMSGVKVSFSTDFRGFRSASGSPVNSRLLMLGDSSTFGWGVEDKACFASLLEAVNGGVAGYTILNIERYLDHYGLPNGVKVVVVSVGWNDAAIDHNIETAPFGRLLAMRKVLMKSSLMQQWRLLCLWGVSSWRGYFPQVKEPRRVSAPTFSVSLTGVFTKIRHYGAIPCFREIPIPTALWLQNTPNPLVRKTVVGRRRPAFYYQSLARQVCAETGVPYIETQEVFNDWLPEDVYLDQIHPTAIGHQIIAKQIAMRLQADKLWW